MINAKATQRALLLAWSIALLGAGLTEGALAQAAPPKIEPSSSTIQIAASDATSRFIPLGIGKIGGDRSPPATSRTCLWPIPRPPMQSSAHRGAPISSGVTVGQTSVVFFDAEGRQIAGFDIAVTRDLKRCPRCAAHIFPDGDIRIDGVGDGVVLTGSVASPVEAQQAFDIAVRLVGDANRVVNGITIRGRDQVLLKVTVAEVQRDIVKQLGIDLNGSVGAGSAVLKFNNNNPFPANGTPLVPGNNITGAFSFLRRNAFAPWSATGVNGARWPSRTSPRSPERSATLSRRRRIPVSDSAGRYAADNRNRIQEIRYKPEFTPVVLSEGASA